ASAAPKSAARPAQGTDIRVVANVVFQEVENLLRIVAKRGGFFLNIRVADLQVRRVAHVGGVGVGRRIDQAGIDAADADCRGGSGIRDRTGVQRGKCL